MSATPCLCRNVHIDCNLEACPQAIHAEDRADSAPVRDFRESAEKGCQTCALMIAALCVPEVEAAWKGSILPAYESARGGFKEGLLEDDEAIHAEFNPPRDVSGRRVIRTSASEESEDWIDFDIWLDTSAGYEEDGPCSAIVPLKCHPSSHTDSEESLGHLKGWLEECDQLHTCNPPDIPLLPTQVLQVTNNRVKVVATLPDQRSRYMTLSHRWGVYETFILTKKSMEFFTDDIEWSTIPRLYQDVITVSRRLGIDYIWIDTLCIVQDDLQDWENESVKMKSIYGNSYLNVAANNANDSHGNLFTSSTLPQKYPAYPVPGYPGVLIRRQPTRTHDDYGSNYYLTSEAPVLLTRGWVLQERYLSPRVVYYDAEELKWECTVNADCQCGGMSVVGSGKLDYYNSLFRDDIPLAFQWMRVSEIYSELEFSFDKDRLVALAGIAAQASMSNRGGRFLAGLWEHDLAHQVCWEILDKHKRLESYVAPSWSWISIHGTSHYSNRMNFDKSNANIDVEIVDVQYQHTEGGDAIGTIESASIRLNGRGMEMNLELSHLGDDDTPPMYKLLHKVYGQLIEYEMEMDYLMTGEEAKQIKEVYLLYWGSSWGHENWFFALKKVPGAGEKTYERLGFYYISSEQDPEDLNKLLEHCTPIKDIIWI